MPASNCEGHSLFEGMRVAPWTESVPKVGWEIPNQCPQGFDSCAAPRRPEEISGNRHEDERRICLRAEQLSAVACGRVRICRIYCKAYVLERMSSNQSHIFRGRREENASREGLGRAAAIAMRQVCQVQGQLRR